MQSSLATTRHDRNDVPFVEWLSSSADATSFVIRFMTTASGAYSRLLSAWPDYVRPEGSLLRISRDIANTLQAMAQSTGMDAFGVSISSQRSVAIANDIPFQLVYDLNGGRRVPITTFENRLPSERLIGVSYTPLDGDERLRFLELEREQANAAPSEQVLSNLQQWQRNFSHVLALAQADAMGSMSAQTALLGLLNQGRAFHGAIMLAHSATSTIKTTGIKAETEKMRAAIVGQMNNSSLPETVRSALRISLKTLDKAAGESPPVWTPTIVTTARPTAPVAHTSAAPVAATRALGKRARATATPTAPAVAKVHGGKSPTTVNAPASISPTLPMTTTAAAQKPAAVVTVAANLQSVQPARAHVTASIPVVATKNHVVQPQAAPVLATPVAATVTVTPVAIAPVVATPASVQPAKAQVTPTAHIVPQSPVPVTAAPAIVVAPAVLVAELAAVKPVAVAPVAATPAPAQPARAPDTPTVSVVAAKDHGGQAPATFNEPTIASPTLPVAAADTAMAIVRTPAAIASVAETPAPVQTASVQVTAVAAKDYVVQPQATPVATVPPIVVTTIPSVAELADVKPATVAPVAATPAPVHPASAPATPTAPVVMAQTPTEQPAAVTATPPSSTTEAYRAAVVQTTAPPPTLVVAHVTVTPAPAATATVAPPASAPVITTVAPAVIVQAPTRAPPPQAESLSTAPPTNPPPQVLPTAEAGASTDNTATNNLPDEGKTPIKAQFHNVITCTCSVCTATREGHVSKDKNHKASRAAALSANAARAAARKSLPNVPN